MKILFATSINNENVIGSLQLLQYFTKDIIYHGCFDGKIKFPQEYDLGISFLYNYKIPKTELNKTWINFHPGPLPEYGGRNIAYHAIMNDAKEFGGTIHYIDENFDTGNIIEVERFPILDADTAGDLVKKSYISLYHLFCKYIYRILTGEKLIGVPQINTKYYKYQPINDIIPHEEEQERLIRALTVEGRFYPKIKIGTDEYSIIRDNSNSEG